MYALARTPTKASEKPAPAASKVRRSIGEWETGKVSPGLSATSSEAAPLKPKTGPTTTQASKDLGQKTSADAAGSSSPQNANYGGNRVAEARACLNKAKLQLNSSKNTKTEIKTAVIAAVDRLFQLVKESEAERKMKPSGSTQECDKTGKPQSSPQPPDLQSQLLKALDENKNLIKENGIKMEELRKSLNTYQNAAGVATYASVAAGVAAGKPAQQAPLHSVVVTSEDSTASGEEILENIRKAVNARDGGVIIDKVRKGKDRKIIIGCREKSEMKKVADRIKERGDKLQVAEMKNKDPQIVLYSVLQSNTDEDIVEAIKKQNRNLVKDLGEEELRMEVRFRRKARNPHTAHVVLKVSPQIWQRLTHAGSVLVDMQRVRVADQSPLIQCSRCLGYGHGRRYCSEAADACSHCGGRHIKAQCAEWLANGPPSCINCVKAKAGRVDHNAFGMECPVRQKWETLARSAVAYC